jgi:CelD/BcsL family acetyltransferase involved in cellulose biosynthesis
VRTAFVPADRITPRLEAAWRDLAGRAAEPNPFQEPDLVLPAMQHLRGGRRVGLLTASSGDRLDGVWAVAWPFPVPPESAHQLPLPVLTGWVEPFPALGTPLVDATRTQAAVDALLRPPWRIPSPVLACRYFADDGPVAAAVEAVLADRGQHAFRAKTYERAVFLADSAAAPSKNRSSRYKKIRKHRDRMAADLGAVTVVNRSDDVEARDEFLRLEASGWKGAAGTAVGSSAADAAWFHDVCARLHAVGRLELLALEVADKPVAMLANFLAGDTAYHYKSAYDESLQDYYPGQQLLVDLIDDPARARPVRDSCTSPENTLFNQLWPDRRTLSTIVLPLHGAAGSVAVRTLEAARGLQQRRAEHAPSTD